MPKTAAKTAPAAPSAEQDLKQKMAKATAAAAPSMVPSKKPPPPPKEDTTPELAELIVDSDDQQLMVELMQSHAQLQAVIKPLEDQLSGVKDRIKTQLSSYGITNMKHESFKVSYTMSQRKSLSSTKLLEAGVSIQTLEECTDITESWTLRVSGGKK